MTGIVRRVASHWPRVLLYAAAGVASTLLVACVRPMERWPRFGMVSSKGSGHRLVWSLPGSLFIRDFSFYPDQGQSAPAFPAEPTSLAFEMKSEWYWGRMPDCVLYPRGRRSASFSAGFAGFPFRCLGCWDSYGFDVTTVPVRNPSRVTLPRSITDYFYDEPVEFPAIPLWTGLALDTAFWGAAWFGIVRLPGAARAYSKRRQERRLREQGRCVGCGYELAGVRDRCPECGREIAAMNTSSPPASG